MNRRKLLKLGGTAALTAFGVSTAQAQDNDSYIEADFVITGSGDEEEVTTCFDAFAEERLWDWVFESATLTWNGESFDVDPSDNLDDSVGKDDDPEDDAPYPSEGRCSDEFFDAFANHIRRNEFEDIGADPTKYNAIRGTWEELKDPANNGGNSKIEGTIQYHRVGG